MDKILKAGKAETVIGTTEICGRFPNDERKDDFVSMTDFFFDGMEITIEYMKNGFHSEVSIIHGKAEVTSVLDGTQHIQHGIAGISSEAVTRSALVAGEFEIRFKTNCGIPAKDRVVTIYVNPDHTKDCAEIRYTVS